MWQREDTAAVVGEEVVCEEAGEEEAAGEAVADEVADEVNIEGRNKTKELPLTQSFSDLQHEHPRRWVPR